MDAKLIDIIRIPYWIAIGLLASLVESWMTYCGQQVSASEKVEAFGLPGCSRGSSQRLEQAAPGHAALHRNER